MRRSLLLLSLLAACSTSSKPSVEMLPELTTILEAKPANGYQIVMPIVKALQPGADNEVCTWTDIVVDHDVDVRAVQAFQTTGGHHVVLYTTTKVQPAGTTRTCTDDDMTTFRFSAGSGGEGQVGKNEAPSNLVYRVPAGAQVVLNHHYINATTQVRDAQSAMNIWLADPGQTYRLSGSLAMVDTGLRLPPGPSTMDIHCTMPRDFKAWYLIPHMHAYGTRITITHTSATAAPETLFDVQQWSPSYTFHPPELRKDPDSPMMFLTGDHLNVHCEWNNTTSSDMTFGIEMCVGFSEFVDDAGAGNLACDAGNWSDF
ncbi:MAG: hypothetical protein JWM53_2309 [bacterium]|nr:hypothetical protein [bacterium]